MFVCRDIQLLNETFWESATIQISVKVMNASKQDSWHSVEWYSRDHVALVTTSMRRRREGFYKLIKAGKTIEFAFALPAKQLSFIEQDMKTRFEDGRFDLMIEN